MPKSICEEEIMAHLRVQEGYQKGWEVGGQHPTDMCCVLYR